MEHFPFCVRKALLLSRRIPFIFSLALCVFGFLLFFCFSRFFLLLFFLSFGGRSPLRFGAFYRFGNARRVGFVDFFLQRPRNKKANHLVLFVGFLFYFSFRRRFSTGPSPVFRWFTTTTRISSSTKTSSFTVVDSVKKTTSNDIVGRCWRNAKENRTKRGLGIISGHAYWCCRFCRCWLSDAGSPASSLSSLSAASSVLRPAGCGSFSALTPSLAAHYRPDLIAHVTGWPAEQLERQATKVGLLSDFLSNYELLSSLYLPACLPSFYLASI